MVVGAQAWFTNCDTGLRSVGIEVLSSYTSSASNVNKELPATHCIPHCFLGLAELSGTLATQRLMYKAQLPFGLYQTLSDVLVTSKANIAHIIPMLQRSHRLHQNQAGESSLARLRALVAQLSSHRA